MITPETKDFLLKELVTAAELDKSAEARISISKNAKELGVKDSIVWMVLDHFKSRGIIKHIETFSDVCDTPIIHLSVPAFDLYRVGGFTGVEANAELELLKLKSEIALLKNQLDKNKYDTLMTGVGTLISYFTFLKPG